ncbi:MAG: ABC transporter permease [Gemmatimonadota bacterium]
MIDDLRYGIRRMLQGRAWTALVTVSLALGIGANTALFSLVEAVVLRDLPVEDPDRLVYLNWQSGPNAMYVHLTGNSDVDKATGLRESTSFSTLTFERVRSQSRTLSEVFAFAPWDESNLQVDRYAEIANGQFVSGNYFAALGVRGIRGRALTIDDDRAGAAPAVVISDALWQRRFERDPAAIGKTLTLNRMPFTIVGITPEGFTGASGFSFTADFSIPLAFESQLFPDDQNAQPYSWWLSIIGRTNAGVTPEQVQAELERVFQAAALDGWNAAAARSSRSSEPRDVPHLQVLDGSSGLADQVRNISQLMTGFTAIVGVLLLLVCVNVANLVLARAAGRQREIGVRLAIGASRARLVRLLLAESLVLCILAGTLGILLAAWGIDLLALFVSQTNGIAIDLRLDLRVLVFAFLISLFAGAASGIAPALRATRSDVAGAVRQNAATLLGQRSRLNRLLLVSQLALSIVLLVVAGLLVRSVNQMQRIDIGFDSDNLLLFDLNPEAVGYDEARTVLLYEEIIRRLEALPGIQAATTSDYPFVSGSGSGAPIHVQGSELRPNDGLIRRLKIRSNFMQTMGVPVLAGRDLSPRDDQSAPAVALVNETLARSFFPGANPVGRRFGFGRAERSGDIEIVGVVKDARIDEVRTENPPAVYLPYLQRIHGSATFELRTQVAPLTLVPSVRDILRQVAPDVPVVRFRTQQQQVRSGFASERVLARTSTFFSTIAMLLACIGLYGVMSYNVSRRTSEIAIRMALGARRNGVVWLVLREVVLLLSIGVTLGLLCARAVTRTVGAMLYDLSPDDPLTITAAVLVLLAVGVLAGYLPARRAANVNPWVALRQD